MDEKSFEREVLERLTRIEVQITGYKDMEGKVNEHSQQIELLKQNGEKCEKDIEDLKDNNKWLFRTIAGALIAVIVEGIFMVSKLL